MSDYSFKFKTILTKVVLNISDRSMWNWQGICFSVHILYKNCQTPQVTALDWNSNEIGTEDVENSELK